ncbi:hypothetical protein F5Y03DRAFT_305805 [Xylaria venustula]|nr:hypothetical protein F5Y03DRAFT_305805 [Xylaria venustula]
MTDRAFATGFPKRSPKPLSSSPSRALCPQFTRTPTIFITASSSSAPGIVPAILGVSGSVCLPYGPILYVVVLPPRSLPALIQHRLLFVPRLYLVRAAFQTSTPPVPRPRELGLTITSPRVVHSDGPVVVSTYKYATVAAVPAPSPSQQALPALPALPACASSAAATASLLLWSTPLATNPKTLVFPLRCRSPRKHHLIANSSTIVRLCLVFVIPSPQPHVPLPTRLSGVRSRASPALYLSCRLPLRIVEKTRVIPSSPGSDFSLAAAFVVDDCWIRLVGWTCAEFCFNKSTRYDRSPSVP